LGFLHKILWGRPSLVCDLQELYRHLVDDFVIEYCKNLKPRDFRAKEDSYGGKKTKRIYLNESLNNDFIAEMNKYFTRKVRVNRIKTPSGKQELETLINEEALLLAKYFRGEKTSWVPRIAIP
jgi:CRISPR/Cas system-associated endonuclease Cas1